jgi:SCP-2 sterol transfer family/N-terminal domain of galactosyltransferase
MTDLSIILPFYKRIEAFKEAMTFNHSKLMSTHERSTEVVLVLDEPTEEVDILELVGRYGQISWRIIINRRDHEWRNPAKVINVGIRHAKGAFVLTMSPECLHVTDVPHILFNSISSSNKYFAVGQLRECKREDIYEKGLVQAFESGWGKKNYYGSICSSRAVLEAIRGYDESNKTWGGDDDNLRARMILYGLEKKRVIEAKVIHPVDLPHPGRDILKIKTWDEREACFFPSSAIANNESWGREFDEIIYEKESHQKNLQAAFVQESEKSNVSIVTDTSAFFEDFLPERLKTVSNRLGKTEGICRMIVTNTDESAWTMDLDFLEGKVKTAKGEADCTITIKQQDLIGIVNGRIIPEHAVVQGRLRIVGDLRLAKQVYDIFTD